MKETKYKYQTEFNRVKTSTQDQITKAKKEIQKTVEYLQALNNWHILLTGSANEQIQTDTKRAEAAKQVLQNIYNNLIEL